MNWKDRYTYNFPTSIRFGAGVIDELGAHLKEVGMKKPLIVTDPILPSLPFFEKILEQLQKEGLEVAVFNQIDKNPVKANVIDGAAAFHAKDCDSIVGFGGGASMDVARAVATLLW